MVRNGLRVVGIVSGGGDFLVSDNKLVDMIQRHEGCKLMPYKCTAGKTTIGYGRNVEDTGISIEEADFMLTNDIECCRMDLSCKTTYFDQCDRVPDKAKG